MIAPAASDGPNASSSPLPSEYEASIRTRELLATKGPWSIYDDGTGRIDVGADLKDNGTGYSVRRQIAETIDEPIDNDPAHKDWDEDRDQEQILADAEFIAAAREDVPALLAELDRMRAVLRDACDQIAELESDLGGATAQVAALEAARRTTEQGAVRAAAAWQKAEARIPMATRSSDPLEAGRQMVREAEASNTRACRHCSRGCHRDSTNNPWTHDDGFDAGHTPEPFKLPQIPPATQSGGQS
jgi:hypothetical protein